MHCARGADRGLEFNCSTDWLESVGHILKTSEGMEWIETGNNDVRKKIIEMIVEYGTGMYYSSLHRRSPSINSKIEGDTALRVMVEARSVIFMRLLVITRPSRCNLSRPGKRLGDLRHF